ncbi:MAG: 4Fe-4S dicluster domain-containing protein [Deltaproteobacteria bacterium]|nr:4Fe-4S dicluster domain-containing protein [Deltaproteobacteria bacterium]MBI2342593.1 4Fe-4S dicluster domain-containing protein [Deltaproteobacteria bacterium]
MKSRVILKVEFPHWIASLIKTENVIGIKAKEAGKFHFGKLRSSGELRLDYDVAVLPPKKYLQPPKEDLLSYNIASFKVTPSADFQPITIIGVHPYDMHGINQMDAVFSDENKDTNYLGRRKNVKIIGVDPVKASAWSFWHDMGTAYVDKGFDLWLTDIGDRYFIEIGTKSGENLLKPAKTESASKIDIERHKKARSGLKNICSPSRRIKTDIKKIPDIFRANHDHGLWEKRAKTCYSCGSCNLVCPTCYCFDVREDMELNLTGGRRVRVWDGCMLEEFARVGSGENFRKERSARFRHRFFRKMVYMKEKIGALACVGCGRCASACLPDIADPVTAINELSGLED